MEKSQSQLLMEAKQVSLEFLYRKRERVLEMLNEVEKEISELRIFMNDLNDKIKQESQTN